MNIQDLLEEVNRRADEMIANRELICVDPPAKEYVARTLAVDEISWREKLSFSESPELLLACLAIITPEEWPGLYKMLDREFAGVVGCAALVKSGMKLGGGGIATI